MSHTHRCDSEEISIHTSCWTMTKRTFFLLVILGFCATWQKADAQITLGKPIFRVPSRSLEDSYENFYCELDKIPTNQTILYQWFKEGNLNKPLGDYSSHSKEEATFTVQVKLAYDGRLICKASVQNNSEIMPTFSDLMDFQVLVPVEGVHIISNPTSGDLWEGDSLTLQCNITKGTSVLYDWLLNGVHLLNDSSNNQITIPRLSSQNSGVYVCLAKNSLNETHDYTSKSERRSVHVKEYLSTPEISYEVVKHAKGNFSAYVKCQVAKGSPSINYTLFINNHDVHVVSSEDQHALFPVPIVLDQDMGTVYCQADNGKTPVQSRELKLKVESVGGPMRMRLEKAVTQDFEVLGVWIYCSVEKGMFPQYCWFRNNKSLENQGPFYRTFHPNHAGLMVRLHPDTAGSYHCEAFNLFDNATRVSGPRTLITHDAFNKIPTAVAATVFIFFSLLICAVLACCIYGVVLRKRQARKYMFRLKDFTDMHSVVDDDGVDDKIEELEEDEYEEREHDDLDTEAYTEDMEVVQASMMEDSDKSEEEEENNLDNYSF
ncbi:hypothetical protein PDJAM_G00024470 [Pangasius djambal]|uniref:Uncharacterized protein n=1 Tax=Pangasius djambal TaxID=1691987 RepID=A0ACC5YP48_9TELE|nr:hypothetical protein [Pangasius djambal]